MNISNKTIEVLKEAGWYEGRKIDISENVKFLEERGFEVFESAKRFMEEFGELNIEVEKGGFRSDGSKQIAKHTTCIKKVIGIGSSRHFGLSDYIDYEVIPIGALDNLGVILYISETGKIFTSIGWEGDTIWEAWDNIILEKGGLIWSKYEESLIYQGDNKI